MVQFSVGKLLTGVTLLAVLCAIVFAVPANLSLFVIYSFLLLLLPVLVVLAVFGSSSLRAFAIGSAISWLIALGGLDAGPEVWDLLERVLSRAPSPARLVTQAKVVYLVMIGWIILGGLMSLCAYLVAFRGGFRHARQESIK
jgi:hypothetical protein